MKIRKMNMMPLCGFTLVELLVVIAIIVSLSAIGLHVGRGAILQAKRVASAGHLFTIVNAVNGFYADYGIYPSGDQVGEGASFPIESGDRAEALRSSNLMSILIGQHSTENRNQIPYFAGNETNAKGVDGIDYSTHSFLDAWGNPYEVYWDGNYNGLLHDPFNSGRTLRQGVIAIGQGSAHTWSNFTEREIVKSW